MADLNVSFMHPTDGRTVSVTLDEGITVQEALNELIQNHFIASNPQGYNLAKKGGAQLQGHQSFRDAGIRDNDIIRIIPATDAGNQFTKGE